MSDVADDADIQCEGLLRRALSERKPTFKAMGACYFCGCEVHSDHLFCDSECHEGWETEMRLKKIAGKV